MAAPSPLTSQITAQGIEPETVPTAPANIPRGHAATGQLVGVAVVTLIAETILLALLQTGRIGLLAGTSVHVMIVTAIACWVWRLSRHHADCGQAMLLMIATAVVGPIAPLGVLAVAGLTRRGQESDSLLQTWYERISLSTKIDPVARLAEKVSIGRTVNLGAPAPRAFAQVLDGGTLIEQQVVLGLIARNFHPEHLPNLAIALASPEPVIRVQAAAVAAHIRDPLNTRISASLASVDDAEAPVTQVLQIVHETELALASGLVEEGDRIRLSAAVQALRARALTRIDAAAKAHPKGASGLPLAPITLDAYEAFLIQRGRFDEFRKFTAF